MGRWCGEPCWVAVCAECGYAGREVFRASGGGGAPLLPDPYAEILEFDHYARRPDPDGEHPFAACFKSRDEIFLQDPKPGYEARSFTDIYREHGCPEFSEYERGYAPKGFQELMMQKWLEEREDDRDEAQRKHNKSMMRMQVKAILAAGLLSSIATGGLAGLFFWLASRMS